jgi:hypothetical protein
VSYLRIFKALPATGLAVFGLAVCALTMCVGLIGYWAGVWKFDAAFIPWAWTTALSLLFVAVVLCAQALMMLIEGWNQ